MAPTTLLFLVIVYTLKKNVEPSVARPLVEALVKPK